MKIMSEEARKARNDYQREYRKRNPDKIKQYNINFWEKKAGNYLKLQVKKLHSQGLSQREISTELGISLGVVNKYLHQ